MPSYHPDLPQGHDLSCSSDLDREVIIHTSMKFQSWIEVVMEATGVFIK
jgi:hypothetical protein